MKWIPGYEGKYKISRDGKVWSEISQKFLKPKKHWSNGKRTDYVSVDLSGKTKIVHRLVAMTYLGNIEGLEVDHINNIKDDNRVENLQLMSRKEHCKKDVSRLSLGGKISGNLPENKKRLVEQNKKRRDTRVVILEKDGIIEQGTRRELCERLGLNRGNLHKVISGKYKQTGGWRLCQDKN